MERYGKLNKAVAPATKIAIAFFAIVVALVLIFVTGTLPFKKAPLKAPTRDVNLVMKSNSDLLLINVNLDTLKATLDNKSDYLSLSIGGFSSKSVTLKPGSKGVAEFNKIVPPAQAEAFAKAFPDYFSYSDNQFRILKVEGKQGEGQAAVIPAWLMVSLVDNGIIKF